MMASKDMQEKQGKIENLCSKNSAFYQHWKAFLEKNRGGASLLQFAATVADVESCKRLIEDGADFGGKSEDLNATTLHYAALNELHGVKLVSFFVLLGLSVTECDSEGEQPVHYALRVRNFKVAEHLLQVQGCRDNLLQFCVKRNRLELAKLVHEYKGSLINRVGDFGETILFLAVRHADPDMCGWLVEEGAEVRALAGDSDASVLHYVGCNAAHGVQISGYLVSLGLDPNSKDIFEFTPLHYALMSGNVEVAEQLCVLGASLKEIAGHFNLLQLCLVQSRVGSAKFVHEKDARQMWERSTNDRSTFEIAAEFADVEMLGWLSGEGVDFLAETASGSNALHFAARNAKHGAEMVEAFVKLGVDPNKKDERRNTPLFDAIERKNVSAAAALLRLGADVSIRRGDRNLLQLCIMKNNLAVARTVHEMDGEQLQELGTNGQTALHLAAFWADLEFCEWVVANGVDPGALTAQGESALDFAKQPRCRCRDVRRFLRSQGLKTTRGGSKKKKGKKNFLQWLFCA